LYVKKKGKYKPLPAPDFSARLLILRYSSAPGINRQAVSERQDSI